MTRGKPPAPPLGAGAILDNQSSRTCVGEYLRVQLTGSELLRVVSAYFTVYAYENLRDELENVDEVRFLYGDPVSVGEVDPGIQQEKSFDLSESGLQPTQQLIQKRLAKDCEEWIKKRVEIRTIKQKNFLHGKMYHLVRKDKDAAVLGSSNFTRRGLGFGVGANLELNLAVNETDTCNALKEWFDDLWENKKLTEDAKQDVLDALKRMGLDYAPELVYYKTLLEIFGERLESRQVTIDQIGETPLKDTEIWKALYQFQRDGVTGIINRLQQYNGCILTDNVGLGKTYTALAVIRYFESQNQRVLVLCPKRLRENWSAYLAIHILGNPFVTDGFSYTILNHTDLSRVSGESGNVDLAKFDWSSYGLVVIDESHNFRNASKSARDDEGNIIRRSRYEKLLEDVIIAGGKTKVLMLSATPVNTSLTDLRNQIHFIIEGKQDAFNGKLGIANIDSMLGAAQRKFKQWEQKREEKNKHSLLDMLGGDFFSLLEAISIARSRRHIKSFYPEVVSKIGGFPKPEKPQTETPPTDLAGELSYEELNEEIQQFKLSIYRPTDYLTDEEAIEKLNTEKVQYRFNQKTREKWLMSMIRINFLKRLESAAPSFEITLQRTIKKIEELMGRIENYKVKQNLVTEYTDNDVDDDLVDESEDDDFFVNKARHPFNFNQLDVDRWLEDLRADKDVLEKMCKKISAITPQRDGKIKKLIERIEGKLKNPGKDKDGRINQKILIFTAFKDTAEYLFDQIAPLVKDKFNVECAMVAGNKPDRTDGGVKKFTDILTDFAPMGRGRYSRDTNNLPIPDSKPEITILIATDCVSEGQNLQDCDLVINYDIHWNPVRLIQRFGRIDRIGSRNEKIQMINFWPPEQLDNYLNLQHRVEARMALMDAAATGDQSLSEGALYEAAKSEINFRDDQLRRLRNEEALDLDQIGDGVNMSDFSIDDFIAQLMQYLEKNREQLEKMPLGVYAVADCAKKQEDLLSTTADPGVIFCLRHKNPPEKTRAHNPLKPYYLIYVRDDGEVRYNYMHARQILELFGGLSRGKEDIFNELCAVFDKETDNGRDMKKYDKLLVSAFAAICQNFEQQEVNSLSSRDGVISKRSERPRNANDFQLITWLVIKAGS